MKIMNDTKLIIYRIKTAQQIAATLMKDLISTNDR